MQLADGVRQVVAGLLAASLFLALYLGASLVWWLALGLAVLAYGALLLLIRRRPRTDEVMLAERVSQADLDAAAASLARAAERLRAASLAAPAGDRADLATMAAHVQSIRELILADPNDYRMARPFVGFYLPRMVETVETYVSLAKRSHGTEQDRLAELGERIRAFGPVVQKIDRACLENDLNALEAEVEALGFQMKRIAGVPS
jgi:hypothetical protein